MDEVPPLQLPNRTDASSGGRSAWVPHVVLLIFAVGGLAIAVLSGLDLWTQHRMLEVSQPTEGVIRTAELSARKRRAEISYTYTFGGRTFISRTLYPGLLPWSRERHSSLARQHVRKYRPGTEVTIYFDPAEPAHSFLIRRRAVGSAHVLGIGSLFALVGSSMLLGVTVGSQRLRLVGTATIAAVGQIFPWLAWRFLWQPERTEPPFWTLAGYWLVCWIALAVNLLRTLRPIRDFTLAIVFGGVVSGSVSLVISLPLFMLTRSAFWLFGSLYFGTLMAAITAVLYLTGHISVDDKRER